VTFRSGAVGLSWSTGNLTRSDECVPRPGSANSASTSRSWPISSTGSSTSGGQRSTSWRKGTPDADRGRNGPLRSRVERCSRWESPCATLRPGRHESERTGGPEILSRRLSLRCVSRSFELVCRVGRQYFDLADTPSVFGPSTPGSYGSVMACERATQAVEEWGHRVRKLRARGVSRYPAAQLYRPNAGGFGHAPCAPHYPVPQLPPWRKPGRWSVGYWPSLPVQPELFPKGP